MSTERPLIILLCRNQLLSVYHNTHGKPVQ